MKQYEYHEAADAYPMLPPPEAAELAADIQRQGLLREIVLLDGKILDGRNRYVACQSVGVEPRFAAYPGDKSPEAVAAYVRSLNSHRRHLTSSQKAMSIAMLEGYIAKYSKAAKERQRAAGGDKRSAEAKKSLPQKIGEAVVRKKHSGETNEQAADGTNRQYVTESKRILEVDHKLAEQIRDGKLTISKVKADEKKQAEKQTAVQHKKLVAHKPPPEVLKEQIKYRCILVDPSWYAGENDADWIETVGGMPIRQHAANDAMVFVRTGGSRIASQRAQVILAKWEFSVIDDHLLLKGAVDKAGKWFKRSVEEIVVGYRGKPEWPKEKPDGLTQCAPGKVHALIEYLTPFADGLRLELFSRAPRKGWVCWPKDAEPVAA